MPRKISESKQDKKRKADYEALTSPFMQIEGMKVAGARALLDLNIRHTYELRGRAPEVLLEELAKKRKSVADDDYLKYFRIAVDYAEKEE
mgnify:FL=1